MFMLLQVDVLGDVRLMPWPLVFLDGAAGAVRGAGAGDGQMTAGAGVVEHDAVGAAVRRDALECQVVRADRGVTTFSAMPVVDVIVLPLPSTVTVPPWSRRRRGRSR
jgi:hypothetical protein